MPDLHARSGDGWDEEKHPRRSDGKFGEGAGSPAGDVPEVLRGLFTAEVYPQKEEIRAAYEQVLRDSGVMKPGEKLQMDTISIRGPGDPKGVSRGLSLTIKKGSKQILKADRGITTEDNGELVVDHTSLKVAPSEQGQGRATKFNAAMDEVYRANGVDHIVTTANMDVGGYTWAKAGWDFDPDHTGENGEAMAEMLDEALGDDSTAYEAHELYSDVLEKWRDSFRNDAPEDWPTPFEMSQLGWQQGAVQWAGKELMLGSYWRGRRDL